jgi:hypothetical protein
VVLRTYVLCSVHVVLGKVSKFFCRTCEKGSVNRNKLVLVRYFFEVYNSVEEKFAGRQFLDSLKQ